MWPKVLTLILAGGVGGRLEVLTDARAKPALPFGGLYRLIDIPLSNASHSGLADVWIVEQYRPHWLNEYLANGRPWDLDRTRGGLRVLPPFQGREEEGFAKGNAAALHQHASFLREYGADFILALSSDGLYRLDYRQVVQRHLDTGADLMVVTTEVALEEAPRFSVVETNAEGRVEGFAYKPDEPKSRQVAAEVFLYHAEKLLDTLEALAEEGDLGDYGDELLPRLVAEARFYAYPLEGYWRDLGTPESYWGAHGPHRRKDVPPRRPEMAAALAEFAKGAGPCSQRGNDGWWAALSGVPGRGPRHPLGVGSRGGGRGGGECGERRAPRGCGDQGGEQSNQRRAR